MSSDESREHDAAVGETDDNALARPVEPPSRFGRVTGGERHLTRRVIAPLALLVVAVPVVALLLLNLRAVSGDPGDASSPASAETRASGTASPSPSASPSPATGSPGPTTGATPTATGPSIGTVTPVTGPAAGGTVLVVRGSDLGPVTQVLFGALNGANLQHVSDTELRVTSPPGAPGPVALAFRAGADPVRSAVTRFTYS